MRITSVETYTVDTPVDVYCVTVPETQNFALENGVIVHNCGGLRTVRGRHQALLPLTGKIMNCFVAGTELMTASGPKPIEELLQGWVGPAFDTKSGLFTESPMSPSFSIKDAFELVEITFEDGLKVRCTPDHLFLTTTGWVEAQWLTAEHKLISKTF